MLGRLIVLLLVGVVQLNGQEAENPFKTPRKAPSAAVAEPPPASTSLDAFQFNGIMEIAGKIRISLYDTKAKRNIWVNQNEIGEFGVTFGGYDEENETVVIAQGGISKKLELNKVKIESLKIAQTRPNAGPQPSNSAAKVARPKPGPAVVETDEEARARIQRVAEEIRRRRAERRQQLEERNRAAGN